MNKEEKFLKENGYSPSLAGKKFAELGDRTLMEYDNDNARAYMSYLGPEDGIPIQMSNHSFYPGLKWYQKTWKWIRYLFAGRPKLSNGALEAAEPLEPYDDGQGRRYDILDEEIN